MVRTLAKVFGILVAIPILWLTATSLGLALAELLGFVPQPLRALLVFGPLLVTTAYGIRRRMWEIYVPAGMLIVVAIVSATTN